MHIIENANKFKVNDDISLGSSKWLNIYNYRNFENNSLQCINQLKENGYKIVATTPHNHHCMIDDLPADSKIALVFGTELTGISDCIRESADVLVKIPMFGFTESFNISVSVAICIHTLVMKMRKESSNWRLTSEQQEEILLSWYRKSIISSDLIEKEYLKIKSQSK